MTIKEKEKAYIRDFTLFSSFDQAKIEKLDIENILESNLKCIDVAISDNWNNDTVLEEDTKPKDNQ